MKKMAFGVVLAAVLAGCFCGKEQVRVGTYNIRCVADKGTPKGWRDRCDDMVALLKGLDVDVCALQEVCPEQEAFLREQMPLLRFLQREILRRSSRRILQPCN